MTPLVVQGFVSANKECVMKRLLGRFVSVFLSVLLSANFLISPAFAKRASQPTLVSKVVRYDAQAVARYDGSLLYKTAFENIRDNHLGLLTPSARAKWVKTWENRFGGNWLQKSGNADRAISQMLESLRFQHDNYFPPADWTTQQNDSQGLSVGIGARFHVLDKNTGSALTYTYTLGVKRHLVVTEAPSAGSPAAIAGLQKDDVVLFVQGQPVDGKSAQTVINQINGESANTNLRLTVKRGNQVHSFSMKRALVSTPAVTFLEVNKNVAYIRLPSFESEHLENEMAAALAQANKYGSLIFDLRGNPGGRLEAAIALFAQMNETGTAVVMKERSDNKLTETTYRFTATEVTSEVIENGVVTNSLTVARMNETLLVLHPSVKVYVLIDGDSASASEIIAGAFKANKRATIIGVKSYGKDVGQTVYELPFNRGISVTSFEFLPGGVSMNRKGIDPDIVVSSRGSGDRQFEKALEEALKP